MQHPGGSAPFYRERTFLVFVGLAVSAAAILAYRITRTRLRRRPGPARFTTEAVLVVDLVGSTHYATHYGEGLAMKARTLLKDRTLAAAQRQGLLFSENTGDGYFMTFPSVPAALRTALTLLKDLQSRPPDLSPAPPLSLRLGISFGEILLDDRGARHGAVINRAFRLEGLTRDSFVHVEGAAEPGEIPDRNRIFLDEAAAQEARTPEAFPRFLGVCELKGFSGLHRVYVVPWNERDRTEN
jgi:class 3 adenylate cyclase